MSIYNAWFSGRRPAFSGKIHKVYVDTNTGTNNFEKTKNAVCIILLSRGGGADRESRGEGERERERPIRTSLNG